MATSKVELDGLVQRTPRRPVTRFFSLLAPSSPPSLRFSLFFSLAPFFWGVFLSILRPCSGVVPSVRRLLFRRFLRGRVAVDFPTSADRQASFHRHTGGNRFRQCAQSRRQRWTMSTGEGEAARAPRVSHNHPTPPRLTGKNSGRKKNDIDDTQNATKSGQLPRNRDVNEPNDGRHQPLKRTNNRSISAHQSALKRRNNRAGGGESLEKKHLDHDLLDFGIQSDR